MKFVYMGYAVTVLIVAALVIAMMRLQWPPSIPSAWHPWIPWLPALLLLWPLKRHLRNRLTKMTILDDRLRYETGLLSRTTRTILVSRVQDVTVHQRVGQRIFGVGDLSIETAGEASRLIWESAPLGYLEPQKQALFRLRYVLQSDVGRGGAYAHRILLVVQQGDQLLSVF